VEPAHDALVQGWDKLLAWRREKQGSIILQGQLTPAAVDWKNEQSPQFLWNNNPRLNLLKQVLNSNDSWLNKVETEFVQQSIRQKHNDTRSRWGIGITVSLVSATLFVSATTFVWTIWSNLTNKPNVIFADPEQKIQGTTDYTRMYSPKTLRDFQPGVFNQIVFGIPKNTPACIDVDQLTDGEKSHTGNSFDLTAPKEPGVYYIQVASARQYSCKTDNRGIGATEQWMGKSQIPDRLIIGIVVVGNVFNFSIYGNILDAYNKNVPNTTSLTGEDLLGFGESILLNIFPTFCSCYYCQNRYGDYIYE
jgi:hypothetical protein